MVRNILILSIMVIPFFILSCKTTEVNKSIDGVKYEDVDYNFKSDTIEPIVYEQ